MLALCEECDDTIKLNVALMELPNVPDVEVEGGEHVEYSPFAVAKSMVIARCLEGIGLIALEPSVTCLIHFLEGARIKEGSRCNCGEPDCERSEPGSIEPFTEWLGQGPNSALISVKAHMVEKGWLNADV